MHRAAKVKRADPELFDLVKNKRIDIRNAERAVKKLPPEQLDVLKDKLHSTDSVPAGVFVKEAIDKAAAQSIRDAIAASLSDGNLMPPSGKYRVIYADPPWSYGNNMPLGTGVPEDHYPSMPLKEICALPIKEMAEDNAVLFLWTTSPHLEESFKVIKSWGFEYKTSFVWDKVKHNMGHYNSVRHEFLLVCVRGSCQPDVKRLFDSVHSEERTKHSVKPDHFYEVIDTIYPNGARVELFARRPREGWDRWGYEADAAAE